MGLFLSTTINKVDKKGRVSVPAAFRAAVVDRAVDGRGVEGRDDPALSFQGIVVFRSFKHDALDGAGMDRMEALSASLDQMDSFSDDQDDLAATIFADARQLPFDGEGRVVIPDDMMQFAGIADRCAFVGRGKTFQIWEPDAFAAHQSNARARIRARVRDGDVTFPKAGASLEHGGRQ